MSKLVDKKSKLLTTMIKKLQHDKDKYERMFAAQYLAKYQFKESKKFLEKALEDPDPEVAECVQQHLEKAGKQADKAI
ncbi:MAG: HEAT repeat domain-containing protein [Candidatus Hodarchaeota archaeon]